MKKIIRNILGITLVLAVSSCNDFLDELPDNRTTLDSAEKIKKVLVYAYPEANYALAAELSTDNIEDMGADNPYTSVFLEDLAYWKHTSETNNDDLKRVWEEHYKAIASANEALSALQEMGFPKDLDALRGEALIARAYGHFVLVNLFANHYNSQTSATDLGIPYMEKGEKALNPDYDRGSVKEVYEKINADIETGLPLIKDDIYSVPKYHFNKAAAYAFAARFNLFYEKWEKAVDYASVVLGNTPQNVLRNWANFQTLPVDEDTYGNEYIKDDKAGNLLLQATTSSVQTIFGPFRTGARFNHTSWVNSAQTVGAAAPWGSASPLFRTSPYTSANLDKVLFIKSPRNLFHIIDAVADTGYRKAVHAIFTTDETLLVRAEANIMLKRYDKGTEDLNTWIKAFFQGNPTFTQTELENFYGGVAYSTDDENGQTIKRKLNPKFAVETGTQENLLHCLLHCRRILTLHEGLRWFDIRRYGIEVPRFQVQENGSRLLKDKLTKDDLRRTLQIPADVISGGLTPNPR